MLHDNEKILAVKHTFKFCKQQAYLISKDLLSQINRILCNLSWTNW